MVTSRFELLVIGEGTQTTSIAFSSEKAALVGRADASDIWLPELSVSREHARISVSGAQITVQDLGSANGTRVGGRRLAKFEVAVVQIGEAIQFGNVVATVRHHNAADENRRFDGIVWN